MHANSRKVESAQPGVHTGLGALVGRHLGNGWRAPVPEHTLEAFQKARSFRGKSGRNRPLLLDSGCGTGSSSVQLALARPDALVIGVDQSAARLARAPSGAAELENLLLLRADSSHFLRLLVEEGWRLSRHYILYPNPWPKPGHLKRRWHGHPVFPFLLRAGGTLELRSNWRLYLEEMQAALEIAGVPSRLEPLILRGQPMTAFEAKYQASGHNLWQLSANEVASAKGQGTRIRDEGKTSA